MEQFLNENEVATMLRLSVFTIRNYRRGVGIGPKFHRFGKAIRYRYSEVISWAESQAA
jgi:hypothetical protein